jgi:hypothetical protein
VAQIFSSSSDHLWDNRYCIDFQVGQKEKERGNSPFIYFSRDSSKKKKDFFAGLKVDEMRPEEDRLHDCG